MNRLILKKTLSLLCEAEIKTIKRVDKYISLQDSSNIIDFRGDAERKNNELSKLKSFNAKLTSDIDVTDTYAAKLASFICEADLEENNEMTIQLSMLFDNYAYWKNTAKSFIINTEALFDGDIVKYSELLSGAIALRSSTEALCKKIEDTISKINVG